MYVLFRGSSAERERKLEIKKGRGMDDDVMSVIIRLHCRKEEREWGQYCRGKADRVNMNVAL